MTSQATVDQATSGQTSSNYDREYQKGKEIGSIVVRNFPRMRDFLKVAVENSDAETRRNFALVHRTIANHNRTQVDYTCPKFKRLFEGVSDSWRDMQPPMFETNDEFEKFSKSATPGETFCPFNAYTLYTNSLKLPYRSTTQSSVGTSGEPSSSEPGNLADMSEDSGKKRKRTK